MELDRTERRVIGCLIEKRWATPDQYPLSLNALVAACNQRSNRLPVLSVESFEVEGVLLSLREKGLVLVRERDGGRVTRYAERLTEELALEPPAAAILAELLLRGPQTATELARRVKRMVPIESAEGAEEILREFSLRHLVRLLPRAAGQRQARWTDLLMPEDEIPDAPPEPEPSRSTPRSSMKSEIEALRLEVEDLRARVERLEGTEETGPATPGS